MGELKYCDGKIVIYKTKNLTINLKTEMKYSIKNRQEQNN